MLKSSQRNMLSLTIPHYTQRRTEGSSQNLWDSEASNISSTLLQMDKHISRSHSTFVIHGKQCQDKWSQSFSLVHTYHATSQEHHKKFSSFEIMFGSSMKIPLDLVDGPSPGVKPNYTARQLSSVAETTASGNAPRNRRFQHQGCNQMK